MRTEGCPPGRKDIWSDIRVIAALEALKAAVLAVNADASIKNLVLITEVRVGDGVLRGSNFMDLCNCPACVARLRSVISADLDRADAAWSQDRKAVH